MKKFTTALVSAAMLACIAPATPAFAAEITSCDFILTASKASVHPGDTVDFTFSLKPNGDLYGFEATVVLPEGLTLVSGSAKLTDEAKALKWDVAPDVSTEVGVFFNGVTASNPYNGAAEIKIATFSCTASASFNGATVTLDDPMAIKMTDKIEAISSVPVKGATISVPTKEKVPATASDCKKKGNNEYFKCSDNCGKYYKADGTETTPAEEELPLADHNLAEVVDAKYLSTAATCKAPAKYFKSCTVCHAKVTDTFNDPDGTLDPTKHGNNTEVKNAVEATCTTPGNTGDTYCKDCNAKIKSGEVIDAGHKGGEATCSAKAVCEVCGEEYGDLDANNHKNTEVRDAKEATETEDGYTGDTYCLDCEAGIVSAGTVINKTGSSVTTPTPGAPIGTVTFPSSPSSSTPSSSDSTPSSSDPSSSGTTPSAPSSSAGNTSSNTSNSGDNKPAPNPPTGVTLAVIPALLAAGAAVIIAKNKKR